MARLSSASHFKEDDHQLLEARGCDSFESFRNCLTVDFAHHRCLAFDWGIALLRSTRTWEKRSLTGYSQGLSTHTS